jgi:hypothetical protein
MRHFIIAVAGGVTVASAQQRVAAVHDRTCYGACEKSIGFVSIMARLRALVLLHCVALSLSQTMSFVPQMSLRPRNASQRLECIANTMPTWSPTCEVDCAPYNTVAKGRRGQADCCMSTMSRMEAITLLDGAHVVILGDSTARRAGVQLKAFLVGAVCYVLCCVLCVVCCVLCCCVLCAVCVRVCVRAWVVDAVRARV